MEQCLVLYELCCVHVCRVSHHVAELFTPYFTRVFVPRAARLVVPCRIHAKFDWNEMFKSSHFGASWKLQLLLCFSLPCILISYCSLIYSSFHKKNIIFLTRVLKYCMSEEVSSMSVGKVQQLH